MQKKRPVRFMLISAAIILFIFLVMQPLEILRFQKHIAVLFPKGIIALEQRNLLFIIQAIMLLVIIPVYLFTFIFSWRYRAHNTKAKYDPDLIDNKLAEIVWWGIPFILTMIIGVITWIKTYELDPYKPIPSENKTMTIQVVALQWKWLFLYPDEKIASMNFVQFPEKTPIHFEITADAPMNSLWIPHLGGQIYAMPKMKTELHLIADEKGDFRGSSANLSGEGFADMHFIARASSEDDYKNWVASIQQSGEKLGFEEYSKLAAPGVQKPTFYKMSQDSLFDQIIMKYTKPEKK